MFFATPGTTVTLPIARIERNMAYLDAMGQAIPISLGELTAKHKEGDELEVFLWTDRQKELQATMKKPLVQTGQIAFLKVEHTAGKVGFVNIGVEEELPLFPEYQKDRIEEGRRYYMTLAFIEMEERAILTTNLDDFLTRKSPLETGQEVRFMIEEKSNAGWPIIVDHKYTGFLHKNDALPGMRRGETYVGYVRENEGANLYISMYRPGRAKVDDAIKRIMEKLEEHRGYLRLTDNTPAEEIQLRLRISKSTFKQAIGQLYKERKIDITPRGIKLKKDA